MNPSTESLVRQQLTQALTRHQLTRAVSQSIPFEEWRSQPDAHVQAQRILQSARDHGEMFSLVTTEQLAAAMREQPQGQLGQSDFLNMSYSLQSALAIRAG